MAWPTSLWLLSLGIQAADLMSPHLPALRLTKLSGWLRQEEQAREAAYSSLQKSQEDTSQKVDHEVAKMQVPFGRYG